MQQTKVFNFINGVLNNMPLDWLKLTTHRLDIYNEELAKTEFLDNFIQLFENDITNKKAIENLPTAYDYIRLGHPLSCVLEWAIAKTTHQKSEHVISFGSTTMPLLAILRKNLIDDKQTQILYSDTLPDSFDVKTVKAVYGYQFELVKVDSKNDIPSFNGTTVFISQKNDVTSFQVEDNIDFFINFTNDLGSIVLINGTKNINYISEIQHVRRRETIAMTPVNCHLVLQRFIDNSFSNEHQFDTSNKKVLTETIAKITGSQFKPLVASSGLSIQYAIMMGLIDDALERYPSKSIKFIVPPNCYGGTNDQARRVATCIKNVEIVDLPVDGNNDMVQSINSILDKVSEQNAIPYIIAEIPTNPRVEVPNLNELKTALTKNRISNTGDKAIKPVFILDQTFCPNVQFLNDGKILGEVATISYISGSKFPSGGKCTAGYCVGNDKTKHVLSKIEKHLMLCDNEATNHQIEILASQMPSMNRRIKEAYANTKEFVNFIKEELPKAKINFVSDELAAQSFMPSVFSLDLPTKGNTEAEKEAYKRALNLKLINLMISKIPEESKFCVSYGQLKGCYWTIPATSTQGTTKESDKDYIVRCSLSPNLDLKQHKKVFLNFLEKESL